MAIISRKDAKAQGLKRYFTGKPCPRGHISDKAVVNGSCCECDKEKNRIRKREKTKNSSKRIKQRARQNGQIDFWTGKPCTRGHVDFRRLSDGKCRTCIREKNRIKNQERKEYMKIAIKLAQHKRRFAKINGSGVTVNDVLSILESQDYKCVYCKTDISKYHELDHIMPLSLGGEHSIENVQCTCKRCNVRKSGKHPDVWAKQFEETKNVP